jgi:hypothetical protein
MKRMTVHTKVRMGSGLRAATHCLSWCGAQAGMFKKHGLDVSYAGTEVGGPEAVAGLMRGGWAFCHTGTLPVAENFLNGGDVILSICPSSMHWSRAGSYNTCMAAPQAWINQGCA